MEIYLVDAKSVPKDMNMVLLIDGRSLMRCSQIWETRWCFCWDWGRLCKQTICTRHGDEVRVPISELHDKVTRGQLLWQRTSKNGWILWTEMFYKSMMGLCLAMQMTRLWVSLLWKTLQKNSYRFHHNTISFTPVSHFASIYLAQLYDSHDWMKFADYFEEFAPTI